jgi:ABC-type transport system substrate-binding protein
VHLRKIAQYYHDMAPALFLHEQYQLDAVSKKVKGWNPVNWVINWHDLSM